MLSFEKMMNVMKEKNIPVDAKIVSECYSVYGGPSRIPAIYYNRKKNILSLSYLTDDEETYANPSWELVFHEEKTEEDSKFTSRYIFARFTEKEMNDFIYSPYEVSVSTAKLKERDYQLEVVSDEETTSFSDNCYTKVLIKDEWETVSFYVSTDDILKYGLISENVYADALVISESENCHCITHGILGYSVKNLYDFWGEPDTEWENGMQFVIDSLRNDSSSHKMSSITVYHKDGKITSLVLESSHGRSMRGNKD